MLLVQIFTVLEVLNYGRGTATTNADDIRFYVSSGVCNMRVPQALVNGSVVQTSDDRLKTDEINFTFNSLEILNRMKPKQYKKYNDRR